MLVLTAGGGIVRLVGKITAESLICWHLHMKESKWILEEMMKLMGNYSAW